MRHPCTHAAARTSPRWTSRELLLVIGIVVLGVGLARPARAEPLHVPTGPTQTVPGDVGAVLPDSTVTQPPSAAMPRSARLDDPSTPLIECRYQAVSTQQVPIRHVAPCAAAGGTGAAANPWRTIAQAMANLQPGEVVYVHNEPSREFDYEESGLRPARPGTSAAARIRVMGAPGEDKPLLAKSPTASASTPLFRLDKAWWMVEDLRLKGTGISGAAVVRVGPDNPTTVDPNNNPAHHIVLRGLVTKYGGTAKAFISFDGASSASLLDSSLGENLDADGRPAELSDTNDHHGIEVINKARKIYVRNNNSYGHNGDSFQCGEGANSTNGPMHVTVDANRFHQDEENAVDIKGCQYVTVRANKLYGYYPPRFMARAPHGDAIVIHFSQGASAGQPAVGVLIEANRLWDNSRAINLDAKVDKVVIRRNLIFDATTNFCGIGAGIQARAKNTEIYHNTLDTIPAPQTRPGTGCPGWSSSERAALRLNPPAPAPPAKARAVVWNNIIANTDLPWRNELPTGSELDSLANLFDEIPAGGLPPGSVTPPADPRFVDNPRKNDYFTRQGSPARDAARAVSPAVRDPNAATYCDDPSPGEPDTVIEPDIGFLESCA
jgi:hypothetical protein